MPTIPNAKHQPDQRAHMAIQLDYPLPLKRRTETNGRNCL